MLPNVRILLKCGRGAKLPKVMSTREIPQSTSTQENALRPLVRRRLLGAPQPGFAGRGHTAVEVIAPDALTESDPFVLLMDDRLAFEPGRPIGAAHPHAGLETVTFVLEGSISDRDEGLLQAGDVAWMTAGRGVVHNEEVHATGAARILQLWVTLPERERGAPPRLEVLRRDEVPVHRAEGVEARIYTGSSNGVTSRATPHVPVTLVDVALQDGAVFTQELPSAYNGFVLPITGAVRVGDGGEPLGAGEIGWFDARPGDLRLVATSGPARALVYAGQRQNEPTVHYGPFVAGSTTAIERMFRDYRAGRFESLHHVVAARAAS